MVKRHWGSFALWGLLACIPAFASGTKLVLFGGGAYTEKAVNAFVQLAGGKDGNILVITWATEFPTAAYANFVEAVQGGGSRENTPKFEHAPDYDEISGKIALFQQMLARASAIFFSGGDQVRIMDILGKNFELLESIRHKYKQGVPIGGKSAGTAAVPATMLTGGTEYRRIAPDKVSVGKGLGLLADVLVDQHFVARQREKRLKSAMILTTVPVAFGVDEDNAVIIHDNQLLEPMGSTDLSVYHRLDKRMRFIEDVVVQGQYFDLKARAVVRRLENGELAQVDDAGF